MADEVMYQVLQPEIVSLQSPYLRFYGVMVSTQDSESCDPSSNLGRTYDVFFFCF